MAQYLTHNDKYDIERALRQGVVGCGIQSTLLYVYLRKVVPHLRFSKDYIPSKSVRRMSNFCLRCSLHLTTIFPLRIGATLFGLGALKHFSAESGMESLRANYADGLKMGFCYWPFVMAGLYAFVPTRFGNLYYDFFNLFWMGIISYLSNR